MRYFFSVIAILAILILPAASQEQRYALLIGNQDYPPEVSPLYNTHQDVERIKAALIAAQFPEHRIKVLKDADATETKIAIAELADNLAAANGNGVGFFYYSGHGGSKQQGTTRENYLIPAGAPVTKSTHLPLFGVSLSAIIESLSSIDSKALFVISDACRSNLPVGDDKGEQADKGFAPHPTRPGMVLVYAAAEGATTKDDGTFAMALAEELPVAGRTASESIKQALVNVSTRRATDKLPFWNDLLVDEFCFVSCKTGTSEDPLITQLRQYGSQYVSAAQQDDGGKSFNRLALARRIDYGGDSNSIAAELFKIGCELGIVRSCYNLADQLTLGIGVIKDVDQANIILNQGCEVGLGRACIVKVYSNFFTRSDNSSLDVLTDAINSAIPMLKAGCREGFEEDCSALAELAIDLPELYALLNSNAPNFEIIDINYYLERGCDLKSETACYKQAERLLESRKRNDVSKGLNLLRDACNRDYPRSCGYYGNILVFGKHGVAKDIARGQDLLKDACFREDGESCLDLFFWKLNEDIDDIEAGVSALKTGCNYDYKDACAFLGAYLVNGSASGQMGELDLMGGYSFLRKACELGDLKSCRLYMQPYKLGLLAGRPGSLDIAISDGMLSYLESSCLSGTAVPTCPEMGLIIEYGVWGNGGIARANELYEASCNTGDPVACGYRAASYLNSELPSASDWRLARRWFEKGDKADKDNQIEWIDMALQNMSESRR